MRIAIVGTGISGLTAAYLLQRRHNIEVFEAASYIGGHTNTITVREADREIAVDTGFIVFNELNYPNLCRLFAALNVDSQASEMSFSVRCEQTGLEYNGSNISTLFSQRRNLLSPYFLTMLKDILRFHKDAPAALAKGIDESLTIADFIQRQRYGKGFYRHYLMPMGASIWSCPTHLFAEFPARFVIEFMANHRLLQINDRPQWRTVAGGSKQYIKPLTAAFAERVHCNTPVMKVQRHNNSVELTLANGTTCSFDQVILACHADQSLNILADPEPQEQEILQRFPYQRNEAVLHTDTRLLPKQRRAWASWNYFLPDQTGAADVTLTYNMNILQGLQSGQTYCVSLNQSSAIDPAKVIRRIIYHHPQFGPGLNEAQNCHHEMIQRRGISYCGAYWGHGFHEDGLRSALAVCDAFGEEADF